MTVEETKKSEEKKKMDKKQYRDSGVKRLFIIAIVEKCPETYENIKSMMNKVEITSLDFSKTISVDLKMVNLLLGKEILY